MDKTIKLNDGNLIPLVGFGSWKLKGEEAYNAVKSAIEVGYRHIDTATVYGNEEEVGKALADSGISRDEIFITTKLWKSDFENAEKALTTSLRQLQLSYVDLYLIHWPELKRLTAWKQMIELQKQGKIKSIGVSNFTEKHLTELLTKSTVRPAVNQVEFNPFLHQAGLHGYCIEKGIVLEAYSPLTHAHKLDDERLASIAKKYDKTPAQILLKWATQQGIVVIPKSGNPQRIRENFNLFDFEISDEDIKEMNQWDENARYGSDPAMMP